MWCICLVACLGVYTNKVNLSVRQESRQITFSFCISLFKREILIFISSISCSGRTWTLGQESESSRVWKVKSANGMYHLHSYCWWRLRDNERGQIRTEVFGKILCQCFQSSEVTFIHTHIYVYLCVSDLSPYIYVRAHAHTQKQEVTEHHQRLVTSIINVGSVTFACLHLWSAFPFFFFYLFIHQK